MILAILILVIVLLIALIIVFIILHIIISNQNYSLNRINVSIKATELLGNYVDKLEDKIDLSNKTDNASFIFAAKQCIRYCEEKAIYDKLSNYGDFYYKLKQFINILK